MVATRNPNDFNSMIEWTDKIEQVANQSGFIKGMGFFSSSFTDQEAVLFDRIENDVTMLASANRRGGDASYNKDRTVKTYSLPLSYFRHRDSVTKQDFLGKRKAGEANQNDTLQSVIAEKMVDMKGHMDETHEYMMLQAVKGNCVTPDGVSIADMFTLFGETQIEVDFLLGNPATNIRAKCAEVKDAMIKNLKTGGTVNGMIPVIVDRSFFDKLMNHPDVVEKYLNSTSNLQYQEDISDYYTWGISDIFDFQGLRFMVYSHVFTKPDGTTEQAIEADTGHVIPNTSRSIFKAVYGPSQRINSVGGAEIHAWEKQDQDDFEYNLMMESAPLYWCTRPLSLIKVTTSS
jgi:hypothetical protein